MTRRGQDSSTDDRGLRVCRDSLARCICVLDALHDGDTILAEHVLDDLAHDLWRRIEKLETDYAG